MKVLIIRFSSIGDIVLTTPVIRCLKKQTKDIVIHYLTKEQYLPLLVGNPNIDKNLTIKKSVSEILPTLRNENYDHIIDLHKNLRTKLLLLRLRRSAHTFNKLNIRKWLLVRLKINILPKIHIVDRYLKAVSFLGIKNDGAGLDYFIPFGTEQEMKKPPDVFCKGYIAIVIGAKQFTKQIPVEKIISLCKNIQKPIVLIGGKEDTDKGNLIVQEFAANKIFNSCGKYNLNESAMLIQNADIVITADTGMMHIAAALKKEIVSIWGNTMPDFGMYPYLPLESDGLSHIFEIRGLPCRPCTKLGFSACPRVHFLCMRGIDEDKILMCINK